MFGNDDNEDPFNFGNSPLGDFIKKMSNNMVPKITVESEVDITGAALEILNKYRAKKLEILEHINKAERAKKEAELIAQDIWDHGASLFGYQSQAALQNESKFMTLDDENATITLKKAEMPKKKKKE